MKKLHVLVAGLLLTVGAVGGALMSPPQTVSAKTCESESFFGFPTWYKGLVKKDTCTIQSPRDLGGDQSTQMSRYIWTIALNILEIVLRILGIVAIGMIIYGGFLYMTSAGVPDKAASGMKTIVSASIGIIIATSAVAIKNLVWTAVIGNANDYGVYEANTQAVLQAALNTVYFIAGSIAVVMIIIGGLNYTTSSGSADKMTKAKNTLLYAIIGLVIVIAAYAITNFIIGRFS